MFLLLPSNEKEEIINATILKYKEMYNNTPGSPEFVAVLLGISYGIIAERKSSRSPALLCWRTESPEKPGWYWFKEAYDAPVTEIVRVYEVTGSKYLCIDQPDYLSGFDQRVQVAMLPNAIWYGPLKEPV